MAAGLFWFFSESFPYFPSQYYFHTTLVLLLFAFTYINYSYIFRKTDVFISEKAEASKLLKELLFLISKQRLLHKFTWTCC